MLQISRLWLEVVAPTQVADRPVLLFFLYLWALTCFLGQVISRAGILSRHVAGTVPDTLMEIFYILIFLLLSKLLPFWACREDSVTRQVWQLTSIHTYSYIYTYIRGCSEPSSGTAKSTVASFC